MTEFEQFLSKAERTWGRKIAKEAVRIWRERGPEAAAKFLRGFECFGPKRPRHGRPCDPIGLLADGSISIGTPDEMRPKLEQWRREQAENGGE